jgi:hypothetical protein
VAELDQDWFAPGLRGERNVRATADARTAAGALAASFMREFDDADLGPIRGRVHRRQTSPRREGHAHDDGPGRGLIPVPLHGPSGDGPPPRAGNECHLQYRVVNVLEEKW